MTKRCRRKIRCLVCVILFRLWQFDFDFFLLIFGFFICIFTKWFSQFIDSPFLVFFLFSYWKVWIVSNLSCYVLFLFLRQHFWYDHMTSQSLRSCFLFICSCSFNWVARVTSFFTLSGESFFSREQVFGHTWLLTRKNDFSLLTLLYFNSEIRSSGCVSL